MIKEIFEKLILKLKDPVLSCDVYKKNGCSHVDGFLCDYPKCSILKDFKK